MNKIKEEIRKQNYYLISKITSFSSSLTQVTRPALISNAIFDQININRLSNQTWSSRSIQLDKIETLVWTSPFLTTIDAYTFAQMSSLKFLALNSGSLAQLDSNVFQHPDSLITELDLSDNPITSISPFAFDGLKRLVRLSLDNIQIPKLYDNVLSSTALTSLETLSMARQSTLAKFNWLAVFNLPKLAKIDLSEFAAGKAAIIDYSLSMEIKTFVNTKLTSWTLKGYKFANEDACSLLPSSSELIAANFPLTILDDDHECTCFVIQAFKFYRVQFTQGQFDDFADGVAKSPACYRLRYNTVSYPNFIVPNELLDEERDCEQRLNTLCRELSSSSVASSSSSQSSESSPSTTQPTTKNTGENENKWDEDFYRTLLIVIGSVSIGVFVISVIILIVAVVIVCRVKSSDKVAEKYELENQQQQQQFSRVI